MYDLSFDKINVIIACCEDVYGRYCIQKSENDHFHPLYYYMRNFCKLIGLEQWYFSLIWNIYMWKLQTF